ncbi:hypothetical protein HanRHA438_Chr14g0657271 [Helianthus annuus]|nr:hypothetical protein HanIR_Chr14g0701331 [Helianthus annuus]KAJ0853968.1 hypothetical protein HanRHA438_Chr14g0657271 [Helianthus annuus]
MTASTFRCVPFRGSFSYNSSDYQFYCFISLLRAMLCFKHFAESIIRGLGQNFHSAEVPE